MRDGKNNNKGAISLDPQSITSDTTTSGNTVDVSGYDEVTIFFAGTVTDGSYLPVIKEGSSSTGNGATAVADAELIGTEAAATLATSQEVSSIGYLGTERYITVDLVSSSTTTGAVIGATAVLGRPSTAPVS